MTIKKMIFNIEKFTLINIIKFNRNMRFYEMIKCANSQVLIICIEYLFIIFLQVNYLYHIIYFDNFLIIVKKNIKR